MWVDRGNGKVDRSVPDSGAQWCVPTLAGTMRLVTLLHEMGRRGSRYVLVAICGGGGHGIAGVVEAA